MKNDLFNDDVIDQDGPIAGDQAVDMNKFGVNDDGDDDDMFSAMDTPEPGQDTGEDVYAPELDNDDEGSNHYENTEDMFDNQDNGELDADDFPVSEDDDLFAPQGEEDEDEDDEPAQRQDKPQGNNELNSLNKALGTDYKSLDELKAALDGKNNNKDNSESTFPEEKLKVLERNNQVLDYLRSERKREPREIVYNHYKNEEAKKLGRPLNDDEIEKLEDKIDTYDTSGVLDLYSERIKDKMRTYEQKLLGDNQSIEKERNDFEQGKNNAVKGVVKDTMLDYFKQGNFYGVKPEKEKTQRAYKAVESGEFFRKVEKDPKLIAELALFLEYRDVISNSTSGPGYSEGIKDMFDELKGSKGTQRRATQVPKGTRSNHSRQGDLKSRFLM